MNSESQELNSGISMEEGRALLPGAGIKSMTKSGKERVRLSLRFIVHHGGKSRQELKAGSLEAGTEAAAMIGTA